MGVCYPEGGFAPSGVKLLPTQLFETAFLLLFTVVLLIILKKSKKRGTTLASYFIGYGIWRFIIEFFRSDPRGSVGALSTSQFISLFIVALGVIILVLRKVKGEAILARGIDEREQLQTVNGAQKESPSVDQNSPEINAEKEDMLKDQSLEEASAEEGSPREQDIKEEERKRKEKTQTDQNSPEMDVEQAEASWEDSGKQDVEKEPKGVSPKEQARQMGGTSQKKDFSENQIQQTSKDAGEKMENV